MKAASCRMDEQFFLHCYLTAPHSWFRNNSINDGNSSSDQDWQLIYSQASLEAKIWCLVFFFPFTISRTNTGFSHAELLPSTLWKVCCCSLGTICSEYCTRIQAPPRHKGTLKMDTPSLVFHKNESCLLKSSQSLEHCLFSGRSLRLTPLAKNSINLNYTLLSNRLKHPDLNLRERKYRRISANEKTRCQVLSCWKRNKLKASRATFTCVCECACTYTYTCRHLHIFLSLITTTNATGDKLWGTQCHSTNNEGSYPRKSEVSTPNKNTSSPSQFSAWLKTQTKTKQQMTRKIIFTV